MTGGVFAARRHPSELGLLCIGLAAPLLLGFSVGLAVWATTLLPLCVLRTQREDRALSTTFGAAYDEYARRVPAFV